MKKLLVLALVLGLATVANATLSLQLVDNGDGTASIVQTGTFTAPADNSYFVVVGVVAPTGGAVVAGAPADSSITSDDPVSGYALPGLDGLEGIYGLVASLPASGTVDTAEGTYFSGISFTGETSLYYMSAGWDSVTFVNSITPEPMTLGLLGLGGLFLRRRK